MRILPFAMVFLIGCSSVQPIPASRSVSVLSADFPLGSAALSVGTMKTAPGVIQEAPVVVVFPQAVNGSVVPAKAQAAASSGCNEIFFRFYYPSGDNAWHVSGTNGVDWQNGTGTLFVTQLDGVTTVKFRDQVWKRVGLACTVGGGFILESGSNAPVPTSIEVVQSL